MIKKLCFVLIGSLYVQFALAQCTASFVPSQTSFCQDQSVTFTDLSSGAGGVVTYSWNFGTGAVPATSTLQNPPNVSYTSPGIKTVTLTYSGTAPVCSSMATQVITVNAMPTASFTSTAPQCVGSPVAFTNTGTTGVGVTYSWDFGSGATPGTSSSQNPSGVVYSTSGNKLITFSINNGYCTTVDTMTIVINATPTASFTTNAPQCQGNAVNFSNTGTIVGVTYAWNFGVGAAPATSTVQNPAGVTYGSPGIKTVALTTTNTASSCNVTTTQNIVIDPIPVASFTSNAPQCTGASVNFTNTGTAVGVVYSWSFGAGASPATSSAQSPTGVTYSTGGSKTVTLTTTNPTTGCFASSTTTITINQAPTASFTSNAPQCTGFGVNFANTGTTGGGLTYAWNFGSGSTPATSTSQNPTNVTYSSSGLKTVTFTITNTASTCSNATSQSILINKSPTATFVSNAPQCTGSPVGFNNTGSTGIGVTYHWDFGNGAIPSSSTTEDPRGIVYSIPGTKLITHTVNNGSCTSIDTASIVIYATPTSDFVSNAPQCTGSPLNFSYTGNTSSDVTFSWNFGVGSNPDTSTQMFPPSLVDTIAGLVTVNLTVLDTNTGCGSTTTQNITINQTPVASFISSAPQCAGTGVNFTTTGTTGPSIIYNWDFGLNSNPSTSTSENPPGILYSTPGTEVVTLSLLSGTCGAVDTVNIVIDSTPVAGFISNAPRCMGDSVNFTSTGTSTNVSYFWDFGINGNPSNSILQNPTGILFTVSGGQTVKLAVTNNTTGCTDTVIQEIMVNPVPVASFTSTAPTCAGTSVSFTNTGDMGNNTTYSWDFGPGATPNTSNAQNPSSITYSSGGNELVTFNVNNGLCFAVDTMTIAIDSLPVTSAGTDTTICAGDSVQIGSAPVAGYTYLWFPSSAVSNDTIADPMARPIAQMTTYILTTTSATGCIKSDTVIVNMLAPLIAGAGGPVSICTGDSVQIGGAMISSEKYSWSPSAGLSDTASSSPFAKPQTTTIYTVTVAGSGCNPVSDMVTVTVHNSVSGMPKQVDTIGAGTSVQLIATGGVEYSWMPSAGLNDPGVFDPIATPDSNTTYVVNITDVFGCSVNDTITVNIIANNFWAPTAFTPNGDGKDDIFYIHGQGITNFSMGVYNRWGEELFHSEDMNQGWDGRRQITGEEMPDGAYIYYVKGTDTKGNAINSKGMINLIR